MHEPVVENFLQINPREMVEQPRIPYHHYSFGKFDLNLPPIDIPFHVDQDPKLPHPKLLPQICSPHQYRFLHAFNLATTLAAIVSDDFPGMKANGIAYPFEYSTDKPDRIFDQKIVAEIAETAEDLHRENLHILEIGGQEGFWFESLKSIAQQSDLGLTTTILDLDLQRRSINKSYRQHPSLDPVTFLQTDAHHLRDLSNNHLLKKPDLISMINLEEVVFDPFSILEQAWDILPNNGRLMVGTSFFNINLPFTLFVGNEYSEDGKEFKGYKDKASEAFNHLHQKSRALVSQINERQSFIYNSTMKHDQTGQIAEISRLVSDLGNFIHKSNLSATLRLFGYDAKEVKGDRKNIMCILRKNHWKTNPFKKFHVAGFSRDLFHVNEYFFPQVHRFVNIAKSR